MRTGRVGRPRLILPEGVMVARVKKRYERRRVVEVLREVVRGTEAAVQERLMATQRSLTALINTAYIERLNATFRARLAPLVRRSRAGVHEQGTRWRQGCGWWVVATTSCGHIEACAKSAVVVVVMMMEMSCPPASGSSELRHLRRVLRIIAGRWKSC